MSRVLEATVQIITCVALVIGLMLVIWELRENREATRSLLTSEAMAFYSSLNTAVMGEETADVLAKACERPDELTASDYYVLDNYYAEILNRYRRIEMLQRRGSYSDDIPADAEKGISYLLESTPGRAYLELIAAEDALIGPQLKSLVERWNGSTCTDYFKKWKSVQEGLASNRQ